jgi:serine/threonine-protein kinase
MTPERHKLIKEIFLEALEAADNGGPDARDALIAERCNGDADLDREVRALLEHHEDLPPDVARPELRRIATRLALGDPAPPEPDDASRVGGGPSSRSHLRIDQGRFAPGSVIAGRYRIVNLIARGGMGEVYRADDLKLSEPVAMKFLPESLAADKQWLDRFLDEVRVARNVSHPNVCRVYDVGEHFVAATGDKPALAEHFLTMEFVEGETLASLHARIGRLPPRKAEQIAQQLCAGLAAIHDEGILHRDLKPSNILIDDKGQAKVTDFGLAVPGELKGYHAAAGTPGYVAPESLAGVESTIRSDIYQLGLVLFELFTGRSAYVSEDGEDLLIVQKRSDPPPPSSIVPDTKVRVEQAIIACLDRDPASRPATVRQVARMLPGGDPLAAALEAGETPSPSVVAMAGGKTRMSPATALVGLALFAALVIAGIWIGGTGISLIRLVPLEKSPQALAENARNILADLGYDLTGEDSSPPDASNPRRPTGGHEAWGWDLSEELLEEIDRTDKSPQRWQRLTRERPAAIEFWYRWSPEPLRPRSPTGVITPDDPPQSTAGMITLRLTPRGRLRDLSVLDRQTYWPVDTRTGLAIGAAGPPKPAPDWAAIFKDAGLDITKFNNISTGTRVPPVFADVRLAWEGKYPESPDTNVRVEAATLANRLVAFRTVEVDLPLAQVSHQPAQKRLSDWGIYLRTSITIITLLGAATLAWRNIASKRGDRAAATRTGIAIAAAVPLMLLLQASTLRMDDPQSGGARGSLWFLGDLVWMLSLGVGAGLGVWVMYVAVEPYVRRLWPQSIISWTRLVHGRIYDHLVGQSLLAGALTGAFSLPLTYLTRLAPRWLGFAPAQPHYSRRIEAGMLDGPRQALGHMIESGLQGVQWAMLMLVGVVLVKMLVRKTWLALLLFGAAMSFAFTLGQPTLTQDLATSGGGAASAVSTVAHPSLFDSQHLAIFAIIWTLLGIMMLVWLGVLVRYGVLALIAGAAVFSALGSLPITGDFERWYAGIGMMGLGLVCAIPLYGAVAAVGARTRAG